MPNSQRTFHIHKKMLPSKINTDEMGLFFEKEKQLDL
jgi:hypothetical protein